MELVEGLILDWSENIKIFLYFYITVLIIMLSFPYHTKACAWWTIEGNRLENDFFGKFRKESQGKAIILCLST